MVGINSRNTKKKEMTENEMVTNKMQEQLKYQEKMITLQQKTISHNCLKKEEKVENVYCR